MSRMTWLAVVVVAMVAMAVGANAIAQGTLQPQEHSRTTSAGAVSAAATDATVAGSAPSSDAAFEGSVAAALQQTEAEEDDDEEADSDDDEADDEEDEALDDSDVVEDDDEAAAAESLLEADAVTGTDAERKKKKHDKKKKKKHHPRWNVPCDINAKKGLCVFDGQKVIVPDATIHGLIGRYTFDDGHAVDSSRFGNHGAKKTVAGPGRGGAGNSAFFDGRKRVQIPHTKSLAGLNEFSLSFWLYFPETLDPKMPRSCPIMGKGTKNDAKLFSINIDAQARSLSFESLSNGGKVTSRARIGPHRWTHVTAIRSSRSLSLYLHGVLDNTESSKGGLQEPKSPLYLGRPPWADAKCHVPVMIDDLRIYNRVLHRAEIEAESFPSLGAIEPSFAHLGCLQCSYGEAMGSCRSGYHLCSKTELNAGGYQVARAMGWGNSQTQIWVNKGNNPPAGVRLAVCCGGL